MDSLKIRYFINFMNNFILLINLSSLFKSFHIETPSQKIDDLKYCNLVKGVLKSLLNLKSKYL